MLSKKYPADSLGIFLLNHAGFSRDTPGLSSKPLNNGAQMNLPEPEAMPIQKFSADTPLLANRPLPVPDKWLTTI